MFCSVFSCLTFSIVNSMSKVSVYENSLKMCLISSHFYAFSITCLEASLHGVRYGKNMSKCGTILRRMSNILYHFDISKCAYNDY